MLAELLLGQPMFPGESAIDQLVEIIKVLGTPTKEQIQQMNPNYKEQYFPCVKVTSALSNTGNGVVTFKGGIFSSSSGRRNLIESAMQAAVFCS